MGKNFKNLIVLTIIIVLCLVIITVSFKESDLIKKIKVKTIDFFKPVQEKFFLFFHPVANFINSTRDYLNLREKIKILEKENSNLRKDYSENINLKIENNALRELLGVQLRKDYETELAKVIGFSRGELQSEITLNKGTNDGVLEGMGVINEDGLIGAVILSASSSCRVKLIDDPRSSIGARILSSRILGMVEGGNDKKIYLNYIPEEEIVFKGDVVVTSEYGKLLPSEILIGRVKSTAESTMSPYKEIEIEPFVDFKELEYVLIIKG